MTQIRRKLSELQKMYIVNQDTPFNVCLGLRLNGKIDVADINEALCKIQQKHHLLRSRIQFKDSKPETLVVDQDISRIPLRQVEWTSDNRWEKEIDDELKTVFNLEKGPMIRMVCITGDPYIDLIVTCHHTVCDATSLVNLMSELLFLLDNKDKDIGTNSMYPEEGEFSFGKGGEIMSKIKLIALRTFLKSSSMVSKLNYPKDYVGAVSEYTSWIMEPEETRALINACKDHGITVHTAFLVAFARAFSNTGQKRKKRQKTKTFVSIRPKLSPNDQKTFANLIITADINVNGQLGTDFWEVATKVQKELKDKTNQKQTDELIGILNSKVPWSDIMMEHSKYTNTDDCFNISNMGKFDFGSSFKRFKINRSLGFLTLPPAPTFNYKTLFISTFNDEITFYLTWNNKVVSNDEIAKAKKLAMRILHDCAGLTAVMPN